MKSFKILLLFTVCSFLNSQDKWKREQPVRALQTYLQILKPKFGFDNDQILGNVGNEIETISLAGRILNRIKDRNFYQSAFSGGRKKMAISNIEGDIELFDANLKHVSTISRTRFSNDTGLRFPTLNYDGSLVAFTSQEALMIHDFNKDEFLHAPGLFTNPNFSPDGKLLVAAQHNNPGLVIFDNQLNKQCHQSGGFYYPSFSPDGKLVVSHDYHNLYVTDTKFCQHKLKIAGTFDAAPPSFSPDGKYILALKSNGITLYDLNGNLVEEYRGHYEDPSFSPDGNYIVAKCWEPNSVAIIG